MVESADQGSARRLMEPNKTIVLPQRVLFRCLAYGAKSTFSAPGPNPSSPAQPFPFLEGGGQVTLSRPEQDI